MLLDVVTTMNKVDYGNDPDTVVWLQIALLADQVERLDGLSLKLYQTNSDVHTFKKINTPGKYTNSPSK